MKLAHSMLEQQRRLCYSLLVGILEEVDLKRGDGKGHKDQLKKGIPR